MGDVEYTVVRVLDRAARHFWDCSYRKKDDIAALCQESILRMLDEV